LTERPRRRFIAGTAVKRPLTLAVFAWWLAMLTLLVRKHIAPPATDVALLPAPAASPRDEWFGIYQGEHKVGYARRSVVPTDTGYDVRDDSMLALALLGVPQRLTTSLAAETDAGFGLRAFRFTLVSPAATFTASGTSDGRRLDVRYGVADRQDALTVPLDGPIHLATTFRPRIAAARPAPGTRFSHTVFSPLTLRSETVTTVVEGRETVDGTDALRVTEEEQGVRTRVWLADDGSAVREEAMLGLMLRAEPRTAAVGGLDGAAPLDLATIARIPLRGTIRSPRSVAAVTLLVSGPAAASVPDDPPRQRMRAGVLRIEREPWPVPRATAATDDAYLRPSPFVESDDPAIVARARVIVGDEPDAVQRAERLLHWVATSMTKEPSATVPSAREVLRVLRGDCNEHAVLLTALARAAGIPARMVAGAVYVDGAFLYHAWSELWLGRWVSADAVFDQMPVDATHVKLIEGGPERHLGLAGLVGGLAFATPEAGA
jgi:transglutaminase superfamily protein